MCKVNNVELMVEQFFRNFAQIVFGSGYGEQTLSVFGSGYPDGNMAYVLKGLEHFRRPFSPQDLAALSAPENAQRLTVIIIRALTCACDRQA